MWKRDCLCGHMWATHGHRNPDDTRCGASGCWCIYYHPRRSRWRRRVPQTPPQRLPGLEPGDVATIGKPCGCGRQYDGAWKVTGWRWCREHNPWPVWQAQLEETP